MKTGELSSSLPWHSTNPPPHFLASNTHAVSSPVLVGCTNACRANISSGAGLISAGVNHPHPWRAYANTWCNPHARCADTGAC